MVYHPGDVLDYWNQPSVESMYDKHLLALESRLIRNHLRPGSKILDAGCGEGEGTLEYSTVQHVQIVGADFSDTRLAKAAATLKDRPNVELRKVDFTRDGPFESSYDFVVSQRFLINLTDWDVQKVVLLNLMRSLVPGGSLLMLEGSGPGVRELNALRELLALPAIPVKWHNLFFEDDELIAFMKSAGYTHASTEGLGSYLMLTRAIRPFFEKGELSWDCDFSARAATQEVEQLIGFGPRFSRLKLWVFRKPGLATPGSPHTMGSGESVV